MSEIRKCDRSRPADDSKLNVTVPPGMSERNRRRFLRSVAGAGALVLAGCLEDEPEEEPTEDDPEEEVTTYLLGFHDADERIEVQVREDEEIMYPALDADVDIPYSCEVGRCGQCTAKYEGDANDVVVHDGNEYLSEGQIEDGWILTCVAYARDDFDLEIAHPDDD